MPLSNLASVLSLLGAQLGLRFAWRRKSTIAKVVMALSWATVVIAFAALIDNLGVEFGLSYGFAAAAIMGLALVIANLEIRPKKYNNRAASHASIEQSNSARKWATFLVAGPLAGVASCQTVLVLTHAIFGNASSVDTAGMATAAIAFPVLWGITAYVVCTFHQIAIAAATLVLTAVLASGLLYLG